MLAIRTLRFGWPGSRGEPTLRLLCFGGFLLSLILSSAPSLAIASPPHITSLSVTLGPEGTPVTINGTNFGSTGTVEFNGTVATVAPTGWTPTKITTTVPVGATTGNVIVITPGGTSNGVLFTVTPHITRLSLAQGPVQVGFVITGTTFGSTQGTGSTVKIGTTQMTVLVWSSTQITVQVPVGTPLGQANVVVTVASNNSNGSPFTVATAFGCS